MPTKDVHVSPDQPTPNEGDEGYTRGEFLTKATLGVGALMAGLIGVPVAGMALAPMFEHPAFIKVDVGSTDDFPEGEFTKVLLDPHAHLHDQYVAQRIAFVRLNPDGFKDPLTGRSDKYTVISNRCAHLGCPVQNTGDAFVCPCHGGAYDKSGARKAGPPVRPLDRFDYEERNGRLWLTGEYSLTNDGKRVGLSDPGQHTDGAERLLSPSHP